MYGELHTLAERQTARTNVEISRSAFRYSLEIRHVTIDPPSAYVNQTSRLSRSITRESLCHKLLDTLLCGSSLFVPVRHVYPSQGHSLVLSLPPPPSPSLSLSHTARSLPSLSRPIPQVSVSYLRRACWDTSVLSPFQERICMEANEARVQTCQEDPYKIFRPKIHIVRLFSLSSRLKNYTSPLGSEELCFSLAHGRSGPADDRYQAPRGQRSPLLRFVPEIPGMYPHFITVQRRVTAETPLTQCFPYLPTRRRRLSILRRSHSRAPSSPMSMYIRDTSETLPPRSTASLMRDRISRPSVTMAIDAYPGVINWRALREIKNVFERWILGYWLHMMTVKYT